MRRTLIVMVAIAVLVCPAGAQQQNTPTGNDLINACRIVASGSVPNADSNFQAGICLGEIEALNWLAPGANDPNLRSCVPAEVTSQQLARVAVAYLDHNPDRLREEFQGLALEALAHAWPCPSTSGWLGRWLN